MTTALREALDRKMLIEGLSTRDVAKATLLSASTIARIRGGASPSLDTIRLLEAYLGLNGEPTAHTPLRSAILAGFREMTSIALINGVPVDLLRSIVNDANGARR